MKTPRQKAQEAGLTLGEWLDQNTAATHHGPWCDEPDYPTCETCTDELAREEEE